MKKEKIKKGLMEILYNDRKEAGSIHDKDDAYVLADRLYKEWGKTRAKKFLGAYEEDKKLFKEFEGECIKRYMIRCYIIGIPAIKPEALVTDVYPEVYKDMERNLRKNDYNVNEQLKRERKLNEEDTEYAKAIN